MPELANKQWKERVVDCPLMKKEFMGRDLLGRVFWLGKARKHFSGKGWGSCWTN